MKFVVVDGYGGDDGCDGVDDDDETLWWNEQRLILGDGVCY